MDSINERIHNIIVCPACHGRLERREGFVRCQKCGEEYCYTDRGQLDLRLTKPVDCQVPFELGSPFLFKEGIKLNRLMKNPRPEVDFSGLVIPRHLDEEILSYFPRAQTNSDRCLDLGCGNAIHKGVCERSGFEYIGLDYRSSIAKILGDAHSLPFRDESFDFVLSIAVLEHIQYPFIMCKEMHRVMKEGARLIGTVSFLEPFHDNSFYHHTHLGVFNSLSFAGFDIDIIAPSRSHNIFSASSKMLLFPKIPKKIQKALVMPLYFIHRALWKIRHYKTHSEQWGESRRMLSNTGVFVFIARK